MLDMLLSTRHNWVRNRAEIGRNADGRRGEVALLTELMRT